MFLRAVFLGFLTVGAAFAELEAATALPRGAVGAAPVRPQREQPPSAATTSLSCEGSNGRVTTYTLSVGHGRCDTQVFHHGPEDIPVGATCHGDNNDSAQASCNTGCGTTTGNGSCTQTTTKN